MSRIPKGITSALGLLIGIAAAGLVLLHLDLAKFAETLAGADYRYLLPCLGCYLLGLGTRAQRWRGLLAKQLPWHRAFHIMNIAYLANSILPLRLGELARISLTSRANEEVPAMQTGSTILVERLLDVLAVVIMAALSMSVAPVPDEFQRAGLLGGALSIGGFGVLIILGRQREFATKLIRSITMRFSWLGSVPLEKHAKGFFAGISPILVPASLLWALFWTGLSWLLSVFTNYFLMLAFFEHGDYVAIMFSIATASVAIAIPVVPGNIGTFEASVILAFTILGYDQLDKLAAFAFAVHAMNVLVNLFVGLIGLFYEGMSLRNLRTDITQRNQQTR